MSLSNIFGILSGAGVFVAYGLYIKQTYKGHSTPNPSTWGILLFTAVLNAFTYFSVVNNNIWQSLIVFTTTLAIFIVFIYSMIKGRFTKLSKLDTVIFILAIAIGIFWQTSSNDRIANLFLQGIYVISYIPTIAGLVKGTAVERPAAWLAAVMVYVFSAISLVLNNPGDWIAFVFPVVNGILGNGTIAFFSVYNINKKPKKRSRKRRPFL